jgi:hypothetical protein
MDPLGTGHGHLGIREAHVRTTILHRFKTFTQYGTKVTHLNKPANGVMAAIHIPPVGSTS